MNFGVNDELWIRISWAVLSTPEPSGESLTDAVSSIVPEKRWWSGSWSKCRRVEPFGKLDRLLCILYENGAYNGWNVAECPDWILYERIWTDSRRFSPIVLFILIPTDFYALYGWMVWIQCPNPSWQEGILKGFYKYSKRKVRSVPAANWQDHWIFKNREEKTCQIFERNPEIGFLRMGRPVS